MNPPINKKQDMKLGMNAIQSLFDSQILSTEVVAEDDDGVVLLFSLAGDRYAVHLRVTRWPQEHKGIGPVPPLLMETCSLRGARPLQLRVNLVPASEGVFYQYHGVAEFIREVHASPVRWKRHLLSQVDAKAWLKKVGGISTIRVTAREGHLELHINGSPMVLPLGGGHNLENPPVSTTELCRSATTSDECWIFTCTCGVPECNGIYSGIFVVHQDGLTIWRSPELPDAPLAVFRRWRYRRAILSATKELIRTAPQRMNDHGDYGSDPKYIQSAWSKARAGREWFRSGWMASNNKGLWTVLPEGEA